jgi:CrcB protein
LSGHEVPANQASGPLEFPAGTETLPIDSDVEVDDRPSLQSRPLHLRWRFIGIVVLGGAVGTSVRETLSLLIPPLGVVPVAIFIINILGAFALGALLETLVRRGPDEGRRRILRLLLGTGFMGGFTTYSTLATGTAELFTTGHPIVAVGYALGTVIVGAAATAAGVALMSTLHHRRILKSGHHPS